MIDMKYVNLALLTVNCNCYVWYINNVYVPFFNVNLNVVIGDNVHNIYHIREVNKIITSYIFFLTINQHLCSFIIGKVQKDNQTVNSCSTNI